MWLYGDSYDCVEAENNIIDAEGAYAHSVNCWRPAESYYRVNPNYFAKMIGNRVKGFSTKSNSAHIGQMIGIEHSDPEDIFNVGLTIRNNYMYGADVIPEPGGETEAPDINGIMAVYAGTRVALNNSDTVMTGVIIENNHVEKMDRGITVGLLAEGGRGLPNQVNLHKWTPGEMSENICLKGNTFKDVQDEIVDIYGEATIIN